MSLIIGPSPSTLPIGAAQLALSKQSFAYGTPADTVVATIVAPAGWLVRLLTDFNARFKIPAGTLNLVAAKPFTSPTSGTLRLRAESPDGRRAVEALFDVQLLDASGNPVNFSIPPGFRALVLNGRILTLNGRIPLLEH